MTPLEASKNPEKLREINTANNFENEDKLKKEKPKFQVGNRVRIYKF